MQVDVKRWGEQEVWEAIDAACIISGHEPQFGPRAMLTDSAMSILAGIKSAWLVKRLQPVHTTETQAYFLAAHLVDWASGKGLSLAPGLAVAVQATAAALNVEQTARTAIPEPIAPVPTPELAARLPTMYDIPTILKMGGYTEDDVLSLGMHGLITFLVVVPDIGACKVPGAALMSFAAGLDEYTAEGMAVHWNDEAFSGRWTIKRDRLRIYAQSWDKYIDEIVEPLTALIYPDTTAPERKSEMAELGSFESPLSLVPIEHSGKAIRTERASIEADPSVTTALLATVSSNGSWSAVDAEVSLEPVTWQDKVRSIADELHLRDLRSHAWDSTSHISERVAAECAVKGITGPHGRLTWQNILRQALQGRQWIRPTLGDAVIDRPGKVGKSGK